MNPYNIQITKPAKKDLYEIGIYISKELLEPETAKKNGIKNCKKISTLEDMPLKNTLVADERLASLRFHLAMDTLALGYMLGTINPH